MQRLELLSRGDLQQAQATAIIAGVPADVGKRELATLVENVGADLGGLQCELHGLSSREGPGNALLLKLQYGELTELFTAFGGKGVPAETVALRLAKEALHFHRSGAAVGEHLADQLLLPMALTGAGSFHTATLSSHLQTNIEVIQKFLPVAFSVAPEAGVHRVTLN